MSVEDGEIRERGICDESVLYDDDVIAITFQGCQSIDLRTVCTFVAIVDVVSLDTINVCIVRMA